MWPWSFCSRFHIIMRFPYMKTKRFGEEANTDLTLYVEKMETFKGQINFSFTVDNDDLSGQ